MRVINHMSATNSPHFEYQSNLFYSVNAEYTLSFFNQSKRVKILIFQLKTQIALLIKKNSY